MIRGDLISHSIGCEIITIIVIIIAARVALQPAGEAEQTSCCLGMEDELLLQQHLRRFDLMVPSPMRLSNVIQRRYDDEGDERVAY